MQKYKQIFAKHYDLVASDEFACQYCRMAHAVDIHHIIFRSQGGKDTIDNLIGLCRACHNKAHAKEITAEELQETIKPFLSQH